MSDAGNRFSMTDKATCHVERPRGAHSRFDFKCTYRVEVIRKDGTVEKFEVENTVVNAGKNDNLGTYFASGTQITAWYTGLVDNSGFSAFNVTDTMGSHAGWAESSAYSESVRQTWSPSIATQTATNSSPMTFTMSGSATIKGLFLSSVSTKGGSTGILWGEAAFGSPVALGIGDLLKVTYTVQAG